MQHHKICEKFELVKEAISGIRSVRKEKQIGNKEQLYLFILPGEKGYFPEYNSILLKMCNLSEIRIVTKDVSNAASFTVATSTFYIPFKDVNIEVEISKIEKELKYTVGFLELVMKKTCDERFMKNASAQVIALEIKKQTDTKEKIKMLEERLKLIKSDCVR